MAAVKGKGRSPAPAKEVTLLSMQRHYLSELKSGGSDWAYAFVPPGDITPMAEVREDLDGYMFAHHPDLINTVFRAPYWAPMHTWELLKGVVKPILEGRGFICLPNLLDDPNNRFAGSRDVLFRKSEEKDASDYKEVEVSLCLPKVERLNKMIENIEKRKQFFLDRIEELNKQIKVS